VRVEPEHGLDPREAGPELGAERQPLELAVGEVHEPDVDLGVGEVGRRQPRGHDGDHRARSPAPELGRDVQPLIAVGIEDHDARLDGGGPVVPRLSGRF